MWLDVICKEVESYGNIQAYYALEYWNERGKVKENKLGRVVKGSSSPGGFFASKCSIFLEGNKRCGKDASDDFSSV